MCSEKVAGGRGRNQPWLYSGPLRHWPRSTCAGGGIGRRARLRALWAEWPVEVRVLFGAWEKPRKRGAFFVSGGERRRGRAARSTVPRRRRSSRCPQACRVAVVEACPELALDVDRQHPRRAATRPQPSDAGHRCDPRAMGPLRPCSGPPTRFPPNAENARHGVMTHEEQTGWSWPRIFVRPASTRAPPPSPRPGPATGCSGRHPRRSGRRRASDLSRATPGPCPTVRDPGWPRGRPDRRLDRRSPPASGAARRSIPESPKRSQAAHRTTEASIGSSPTRPGRLVGNERSHVFDVRRPRIRGNIDVHSWPRRPIPDKTPTSGDKPSSNRRELLGVAPPMPSRQALRWQSATRNAPEPPVTVSALTTSAGPRDARGRPPSGSEIRCTAHLSDGRSRHPRRRAQAHASRPTRIGSP